MLLLDTSEKNDFREITFNSRAEMVPKITGNSKNNKKLRGVSVVKEVLCPLVSMERLF